MERTVEAVKKASVTSTIPVVGAFGREMGLACLVGLCAGGGAVFFYFGLQSMLTITQKGLVGIVPPAVLGEPEVVSVALASRHTWLLVLLPTLGALASGLIAWLWAPEAAGHGTDAAIDAYHTRRGHIAGRVPIVKAITAILVIGTGGSGGREGPIAQIGAGLGSFIARRLELSDRERRVLMAAGMGAGVGAIFRAPLAGAIFAGEILYSSAFLEPEVLLSAVIASIVGYSVFGSTFGWETLFRVPSVGFESPLELVPYTVLALATALAGLVFVRVFYGLHAVFARLPVPPWLRPAIGGALTGCVICFVPGAGFTGYGEVQEALLGHRAIGVLLMLSALRIVTTSFSIGSGGSGGVFGPSMVIGGNLGGAIGLFFYEAWPNLIHNPASFVIVGMAGFFAGIAHAPISTIIMVSEMTGNYRLLVPSMWVCAITFLLSKRVSLYRKQVASRSDSDAHRAEFAGDLFQDTRVEVHMNRDVECVHVEAPLEEVRRALASSPHRVFPVIDGQGAPLGLFSFVALRERKGDGDASRDGAAAGQLMRSPAPVLAVGAALSEAAHILCDPEKELVLIVDLLSRGRLVGIISRSDLVVAHGRLLEARLGHPGTARSSGPV